MPVPSVLTDLSVSEASNSPADTEVVTATTRPSDYLRAQAALLRRLRAQGAAVASAATVDLGAITDGEYVHVTGTVTITSFGTIAAGVERTVVFDAALTLTHNATSLILPGGVNIVTAAGDVAVFVSEGSGNWRCKTYVKASGDAINPTLLTTLTTTALATTIEFTGLDINTHKGYRIEISYLNGTATSHGLSMYVNGLTTATDYYRQHYSAEGTAVSAANANDGLIASVSASERAMMTATIDLAPGGYPYAISNFVRDSGTALKNLSYSWVKTASVANITSLTFTAGVADGIGIGTTFRIFRGDK